MEDKELRKVIGNRLKTRRKELKLSQKYVGEQIGVDASTIMRYEKALIDNTKNMIVDGLAEALHVSPAWLRGETDDSSTEITDNKEALLKALMDQILSEYPLAMTKAENDFSKDLLLVMLKEYQAFIKSFALALKKYGTDADNGKVAESIGFGSGDEYNEVMFLREITHSVNTLNALSDILRMYRRDSAQASKRMENLLEDLS